MEFTPLLLMGILLIAVGIANLLGKLSTIHWYNRRRVREEDAPRYGKAVGLGTIIIGTSITLTAVLQMLFDLEALYYLIVAGVVIGIAFIVYAQFHYNKGIF